MSNVLCLISGLICYVKFVMLNGGASGGEGNARPKGSHCFKKSRGLQCWTKKLSIPNIGLKYIKIFITNKVPKYIKNKFKIVCSDSFNGD